MTGIYFYHLSFSMYTSYGFSENVCKFMNKIMKEEQEQEQERRLWIEIYNKFKDKSSCFTQWIWSSG